MDEREFSMTPVMRTAATFAASLLVLALGLFPVKVGQ
jgi:hypothetical protein